MGQRMYELAPTLGYVDATHQSLRIHNDRTVWTRIDVMRMDTPWLYRKSAPSFLVKRRALTQSNDQLVFANSDLSGFSIFEEAEYRGVCAANCTFARLGGSIERLRPAAIIPLISLRPIAFSQANQTKIFGSMTQRLDDPTRG